MAKHRTHRTHTEDIQFDQRRVHLVDACLDRLDRVCTFENHAPVPNGYGGSAVVTPNFHTEV